MKKIKVLIVEDDQALVGILKQALRASQFDIVVAGSAQEGLDQVLAQKPQVVVLDLLLPGQTGFELLKKIKGRTDIKNIPVVILSNLGQAEEVRAGLKLGADSYLVKADFTIDEVVNEIMKMAKKSK